jgi:DNA-directed RNA polymerase sigma subunit (sigma70/sigma32)
VEKDKRVVVTTTTRKQKRAGERTKRPRARDVLSPKEEQVLRMRYGIAASPEQPLEFRGQDNEETRIKLALLERAALEALESRRSPSKKAKIVKKLSEL